MRGTLKRAGSMAAFAALSLLAAPAAAWAGTVSLWHMNETSGTTMTDSVDGNNGTLKNVQLGQPGTSGSGYSFNGSSSVVKVPSKSNLNPGSGTWNMTVHVKFSQPPKSDTMDLIRRGYSSTSGGDYKMEIQTSGKASCHFKGSSGSATVTSGSSVANGSWHTIQCKKQSSSIAIVVDGKSYTKSVTIGSISNSSSMYIGAKGDGTDWYKGLMDEVSVGT